MPDIRYEFKPRVNAALMSRFQNKTVLLVGQVLPSQQPGIGLLRAPDGQTVTVQLAPGSTFQQDFVEVEGTVVGQNRLQEANHHEIYEAVGMSCCRARMSSWVRSRSASWAEPPVTVQIRLGSCTLTDSHDCDGCRHGRRQRDVQDLNHGLPRPFLLEHGELTSLRQVTFIQMSLCNHNHSASNMSDFHLATLTLVVTSLTLSPSCSV